MTSKKKVLTVLTVIRDKHRISPKNGVIFVEQERLLKTGLDEKETNSIINQLRDDYKCIEVLGRPIMKVSWPTRVMSLASNLFEGRFFFQDSYKLRVLANFDGVYSEIAAQAEEPVKDRLASGNVASLNLVNLSRPEVIIDGVVYRLNSMRGKVSEIIEYCLVNHPGKEVTLETLQGKLSLSGVRNLKSSLQRSFFDPKNGLLRAFAIVKPYSIQVNKTATLDKEQIDSIKKASEN